MLNTWEPPDTLRSSLRTVPTQTATKRDHIYELLILGGGPSGLTAGLYAARYGIDTKLIEPPVSGQHGNASALFETCLGCVEGPGAANTQRIREQAMRFGLRTRNDAIESVELTGHEKVVQTPERTYRAGAVILAFDAQPSRLNVPGEDRFWGRGVHLCATCDGPLYMGGTVAVIGGGEVAIQEATFLARSARVVLIHDRDRLQARIALQDRLAANPNITVLLNRCVDSINGHDRVTRVVLREMTSGAIGSVPIDAVFLCMRDRPDTSLTRGQVTVDRTGHIRADAQMRTSLPHVYVAVVVRSGAHRRIVTASSDGAIAAMSAVRDLLGG